MRLTTNACRAVIRADEPSQVDRLEYHQMRKKELGYHRTARIHHPASSSCSIILDFSVSIESTASPSEKLLGMQVNNTYTKT